MSVRAHSSGFADLLLDMQRSLAVSTYHNGRVIVLRPVPVTVRQPSGPDGEAGRAVLEESAAPFENAMAMAVVDDALTVTGREALMRLGGAPAGGREGGGSGLRVDSRWRDDTAAPIPGATGRFDIHGLGVHDGQLWAVNTQYSCLGTLRHDREFVPAWRPAFISSLAPEDRCHLNGMAMGAGGPAYVTMLGDGNAPQGWRERVVDGGVLMDVADGTAVLSGLPMPHSPRLCNGELYVLLSATGEVARVDLDRGSYEVITRLDGFARGMAVHNGLLFVGMSRLRASSRTFRDLPVAPRAEVAGVRVVEARSGAVVGWLDFDDEVEELFDLVLLPLDR